MKPKYKIGQKLYYIQRGYTDLVGIFKVAKICKGTDKKSFWYDSTRDKYRLRKYEPESCLFSNKIDCIKEVLNTAINANCNKLKTDIAVIIDSANYLK